MKTIIIRTFGNTKLTEDVVIQIKERLLTNSAMEVANEFNLTYTIVWKIKKVRHGKMYN